MAEFNRDIDNTYIFMLDKEEFSYLLPAKDEGAAYFYDHIDECKSPSLQNQLIQKSGLVLHDSVNDLGNIRPAHITFVANFSFFDKEIFLDLSNKEFLVESYCKGARHAYLENDFDIVALKFETAPLAALSSGTIHSSFKRRHSGYSSSGYSSANSNVPRDPHLTHVGKINKVPGRDDLHMHTATQEERLFLLVENSTALQYLRSRTPLDEPVYGQPAYLPVGGVK